MKKLHIFFFLILSINLCLGQIKDATFANKNTTEDYRKKIEADLSNLKNHENYINSFKNIEDVLPQYDFGLQNTKNLISYHLR